MENIPVKRKKKMIADIFIGLMYFGGIYIVATMMYLIIRDTIDKR